MTTETTVENPGTVTAAPTAKKWQTGAGLGPRMAKEFNGAVSAASWAARTVREISGTIGGEERSYDFVQMFGGPTHPDYADKAAEIGERYGWTVTQDNYKAIVREFGGIKLYFEAHPMIKDERKTPEAATEAARKLAEMRAENDAAQAARVAAENAEMAGARALYPWAKRDASHQANGAANMRRLLGVAFPGVTFRMKSDSYSGGSSIYVSWTDGPIPSDVKAISDQFQDSDFDGMTDMSNYRDEGEGFRQWMGYAKYVSESRHVSESITEAVKTFLTAHRDIAEWEVGDVISRETWQLLNKTAIPAGASVKDLKWEDDNGWVIEFTAPEVAPVAAPVVSVDGVTVSENEEKDGVEVRFPSKPAPEVIDSLKAHGFRWARFTSCWYHKRNAEAVAFARSLAGSPVMA